MFAYPATEGSSEARTSVWLELEFPRAMWELCQFLAAGPLLRLAPRGTGRPVLVFPGFLTDDSATETLRRYLTEQGHSAHPWGIGVNLGPTEHVMDGIEARLEELAHLHGEAVALIGVSLGGLYARDLALRRPDLVRQVITLGSPFRIEDRSQSSLGEVFEALSYLHVDADRFSVWNLSSDPLPMPATAIYTRTDGVVAWETCVDPATPVAGLPEPATHPATPGVEAENIEVMGSHSGLVHLPSAVYAVADRLARTEWAPFAPPAGWRHLYP